MDADGKVTACLGFCNRVYHTCIHARFRGERIGDLFANGSEFCEAQNFAVTPHSSSNTLHPESGIIVALSMAVGAWLVAGELPTSISFGITGNSFRMLLLLLGAVCVATAPAGIQGSCPFFNYRAPTPQWVRMITLLLMQIQYLSMASTC